MKAKTLLVFLPVFLWAGTRGLAEDDASLHFIGAQAGLVNYVAGNPVYYAADQPVGRSLSPRMMLHPMSLIETGQNDRVEILLNPGSFLRIAENSVLRLTETKFENMQFALEKGTLILESAAFEKKLHAMRIVTPAGDVTIEKAGLYRFESDPDQGKVSVSIRRGKAQWLREGQPVAALKSGKRFELPVETTHGNIQVAKIGKEQMDSLDQWSMRRAEYLVAASDRASSLGVSEAWYSSYYRRGWRGGWLYDPFFQMFTFIPFGSNFYSPYGFSYLGYAPYWAYRGYGGGGGYGHGNPGGVGGQRPSGTGVSSTGPMRGSSSPSLSRAGSIGADVHSRGSSGSRSRGR